MVVDQELTERVRLRTDRVFHALSDATRRDIVARAMQEEHSVSALARLYPISLPAVQKHVAILERAGMVHKRRRGREQIVVVDIGAIRDARTVLDAFEAVWVARLDRFGDVLADLSEGATA